jgi:hypothetical protein
MNDILGRKVKDRIAGFKGIATGYVSYLTGCNQVLVAPPVGKDGSAKDSNWFDESRLEVDRKTAAIKLETKGFTPGFDKTAPAR